MKVVEDYPPNYKKVTKHFPAVRYNKSVVFTYGDTLYNPGVGSISEDLMVHEQVHEKQQDGLWIIGGAKRWWGRYLRDPVFRLSQEAEAYKKQYEFVKGKIKDRELLHSFLTKIASDLSSPIYGEIVSFELAMRIIKNDDT